MQRTYRALCPACWAGLLVSVVVLAGCSDSSSQITGASVQKTPPGPVANPSAPAAGAIGADGPTGIGDGPVPRPGQISWQVRDARPGTVDDVVGAYQRFVTLSITLLGSPRPDDSRIKTLASGDAASALVRKLTALRRTGYVETGTVSFRPRVIDADPVAGTAAVDDCADYSHFGYDRQQAKGRASQPLRATLQLTAAGRWQVTSWKPGSAEACS